MRRSTAAARAAGIAALGVLLVGCDAGEPGAMGCRVDVASADLVADREAAGIASCASIRQGDESADLPDVELDCLGETGTFPLDAVAGPAVINFWASNCGPCREELPVLQAFSEQYGDQVQLLGVDYLETYPGAAIDLARQSGVTYPSLADACGDLAETDLVIQGLPQFVFVAADGSITQRAGGIDTLEEMVTLAEASLALDLPAPSEAGA